MQQVPLDAKLVTAPKDGKLRLIDRLLKLFGHLFKLSMSARGVENALNCFILAFFRPFFR